MSNALPLIQTITPDRWAGLSMNFINAGYIGLLVKNGQLVRRLEPGRHFSFALPYLEQCQIILVDGKIRSLEVVSEGDFVSRDQYLVNISLSVMYQVVEPKRVALELSDPVGALTSAVKDNLGVIVNLMRFDQLTQIGRVKIRDYLISNPDSFYTLGFNLDDVRVSDISFPQTHGVVRQLEGLTAREESAHAASLRSGMNAKHNIEYNTEHNAEQTAEQTVRLDPNSSMARPVVATPDGFTPLVNQATDQLAARVPLPPTTLAASDPESKARLVNYRSEMAVIITANPFTIGRETHNTLVLTDDLCSRSHARIERIQDAEGKVRYQLIDVGSSNGTYLNDQKLVPQQPVLLSPNDRIKIGAEEWLFES